MPKGKRNVTPKTTEQAIVVTDGKVTLKSFLLKIRDLCRNKGAQMDENGNIYADLIYDDLLFLKHVWWLAEKGILTMDTNTILEGLPITDIKLESIASLKQQDLTHVGNVFDRVWTGLQRSNLKDIFERQFPLTAIKKDDKLKAQYLPLLADLLEYVGKVQLEDHEDTDPYEYFTQDLKKSKSKYFGQFYTPQAVTESCVEEIEPKYGELGLDPAAGTGKFMRTGAQYIHKKQPKYSEWEAFQYMKTIEIESKIYRQGVLGTFIKYKQLPNMNYLRKGNSFDILPKEDEQFDYILGNPPYGGTVDGFEDLYYDTEMVVKGKRTVSKKVVKPTIRHPFPFIKKDTSVLFLQLCVNKLKEGGRGAIVFNGTIMNDSHRDVMKWFLDCCDLRKIIVNPSGTFQCTGIETYSLIFWKGSPTHKIEYYDVSTKKKLGEFTRAELEAKNWDIRPIFNTNASQNNNTCFITPSMAELFTIEKGKAKASEVVSGDYPFVTTADGKTSGNFTTDGENVFINIVPTGQTHSYKAKIKYVVGKCDYSSLMMRIIPKDSNRVLLKYIYYLLTLNNNHFKKVYNADMYLRIDWEKFWTYTIPLPPLSIQQEIVATLDRIYNPGTTDLADTLKLTSQAMDLVLANPGGATLEPIVEIQRTIRKSAQMVADLKAQMVAIMKSVGSRGFEIKKLSEACDISKGKRCLEAVSDGGYPYQDVAKISRMVSKFILDTPAVLTPRAMSIGRFVYVDEKCHPSDDMFILKPKDGLHAKYLYYYSMLLLSIHFKESLHGVKPTIDYSVFDYTNITIPPLDFQQSVLVRLEALQSQLTALESLQKQSEDNARFILDSYLSTKSDTIENSVADDSNENTISHA